MDMTLGLLADAANTTANQKLNVLGVFSNISVIAFPAAHPMMNLVLRFKPDRAESGQEKKIEAILLDPDGQELGKIEASFVVPAPVGGVVPDMQAIIPLPNVIIRREGPHAFSVLVNGDSKGSVPFTVALRPPPTQEQGEPA